VSTYATDGDLLDFLVEYHCNLNDIDKIAIIVELLDSLMELHQNGIFHRDIKPENVVLQKCNNRLKLWLIDFDYATCLEVGVANCGSPKYAAPELSSENSYDTQRADIYSFASMLITVLLGRQCDFGPNKRSLNVANEQQWFTTIHGWKHWSENYSTLATWISQALSNDPEQRPTLKALSVTIMKIMNNMEKSKDSCPYKQPTEDFLRSNGELQKLDLKEMFLHGGPPIIDIGAPVIAVKETIEAKIQRLCRWLGQINGAKVHTMFEPIRDNNGKRLKKTAVGSLFTCGNLRVVLEVNERTNDQEEHAMYIVGNIDHYLERVVSNDPSLSGISVDIRHATEEDVANSSLCV
jgi:serine/threonine protein kinase